MDHVGKSFDAGLGTQHKRRVNVQPEVAATILENVKIGMIDATLFHDCVINQDFQNTTDYHLKVDDDP